MTSKQELAERAHRAERRRILRFLKFQARTGFGLDPERCKFDPVLLATGRRYADYDGDYQDWKDFREGSRFSRPRKRALTDPIRTRATMPKWSGHTEEPSKLDG